MNENNMGERIAYLLQKRDMSQKELADRIGVTEVSMYRYIAGERDPKGSIIANLAKALHTTTDFLLLGLETERDFESEYYKILRLIARNAKSMTEKQKKELVLAIFDAEED
jgi:transcriptional regulator with XRE-family HTH domain